MNEYKINLFRDYSEIVLRFLKETLIEKNAEGKDEGIVGYATPQLAYVKYLYEIKNGSVNFPLFSFYLKNIELTQNQQMGRFSSIKTYEGKNCIDMISPLIYSLYYEVHIGVNLESQGDYYQAKLLLAAPQNRNYWAMLEGQYVCLETSNPQNLTTIETPDSTEKISRRSVDLKINRAYLNYPVKESDVNQINEIIINSTI